MRFLIIDDDFDSCQLLKKRLEPYGSSDLVLEASNAFDIFLAAVQANRPYDVLFLDIVMPGTDGHVLLKKIREWEDEHQAPEKKTRIVMVSVKKDPTNIFSSVKEGCDHYMTKPIRKAGVEEVMKKLGIDLKA